MQILKPEVAKLKNNRQMLVLTKHALSLAITTTNHKSWLIITPPVIFDTGTGFLFGVRTSLNILMRDLHYSGLNRRKLTITWTFVKD